MLLIDKLLSHKQREVNVWDKKNWNMNNGYNYYYSESRQTSETAGFLSTQCLLFANEQPRVTLTASSLLDNLLL